MLAWQYILLVFSGLCIFNSLIFIIYMKSTRTAQSYKSIFIQIILAAFILQILSALLELFVSDASPYIWQYMNYEVHWPNH